jgi:hypothetical protein
VFSIEVKSDPFELVERWLFVLKKGLTTSHGGGYNARTLEKQNLANENNSESEAFDDDKRAANRIDEWVDKLQRCGIAA